MKKLCFLFMLSLLVNLVFARPVYQDVPVQNSQGMGVRIVGTVESQTYDKSYLRFGSGNWGKIWLQFDLGDVWAAYGKENLQYAHIKIWSENGTGRRFNVAGLIDGFNESWTMAGITWSNAPGNNPAVGDAVDASRIYGGTYLWRVNSSATDSVVTDLSRADLGTNFDQCASYESVSPANELIKSFLLTDTDGLVTLIAYDSANSNQSWWTGISGLYDGDVALGYFKNGLRIRNSPTLILGLPPLGADNPEPYHRDIVKTNLAQLSWSNPESDNPVICTVYLGTGTEPNRLAMDSITLAPDATSVAINTTNFPTKGNLQDGTQYWWIVDCDDSPGDPNLIEGMPWTFYANNNELPVVNAGPDQAVWMPDPNGVLVNLDGTVTDDGKPNPPAAMTYLWTRTSGPAAVTITPSNTVDTSVTLTVRGTYVFQLTADDDDVFNRTSSDTVQVIVGNSACDASHLSTGAAYDQADVNQDCIVDLLDFYGSIAEDWLVCTDTITNCGM